MNKELKQWDFIKYWLGYTILSTIAAVFAGFFVGVVLGVIFGVSGVDPNVTTTVCGVMGMLVSIPATYPAFWFVTKRMVKNAS